MASGHAFESGPFYQHLQGGVQEVLGIDEQPLL